MLKINDSLVLPENSDIIAYCQSESDLNRYIVYYLSSNELLISSYSKSSSLSFYDFLPWLKNYKITSLQFSLLHNYLHVMTTNNIYIIIPFSILLDKTKRKKWEDFALSYSLGGLIDSNIRTSESSIKGYYKFFSK